ncbi:Hypothetical predicted protein, partial [Paramuricea clavata]
WFGRRGSSSRSRGHSSSTARRSGGGWFGGRRSRSSTSPTSSSRSGGSFSGRRSSSRRTSSSKKSFPHDIKTKSGLTKLYNQKVVNVQPVERPLAGLNNGKIGKTAVGIANKLGVKTSISGQKKSCHALWRIVVRTKDGGRYLVHKGDEFWKSSQTVVVDAKHMGESWKNVGKSTSGNGKYVGAFVKAGGKDYKLRGGNCHDATDNMKNLAGLFETSKNDQNMDAGRDEQHSHRQQEEAFDDDEPNASPQDEQSALHGQHTSSQSMNSDVSNEQFAKTLATMNENMANMAATLGQIWQHVDSGGKTAKAKKRQQEDQYSSESERDEHTAKRRRSAHENEDSLSVTASDDEEINEKYKQPLNCEAMRVSRINPEIWSQISQHKKKTDLRLSRMQQNVQKAVFATLQMAETLSAKNQPSALTENKKGNDREALLRIAVNLIAMLGHMNADVMSMRQESSHATVPPNSKFLFGDDLAKLVRDSKEINSIASTLTLPRTARNTSTANTSRRNTHT